MRAQRERRARNCAQAYTPATEAVSIDERISLAVTASCRAVFAFLDLGVDFYWLVISMKPFVEILSFAPLSIDQARRCLVATGERMEGE
jgi:hypothetical protein